MQSRVASTTRQCAVREVSTLVLIFWEAWEAKKDHTGCTKVRDEKVDKPVILLQNKPLVAIFALL
ncbi:hypothetical protein PspLS_09490 [Pyricularia sp. CBS 133598]|nr:hypothetical protein PspLS_09490 [Pyricularia sp. CBS 133598]